MNAVMQTIPISDLRFHQSEILDKLSTAPVVLTRQGRETAVLVSPQEWNSIVEQLEDLEDALAVAEARLAEATGADELLDWQTVRAELDRSNAPELHDQPHVAGT
ncbi:MAG: type II toxin-antitoxin system Phd/YefM family antitoxin [Caldilineaceae bacterium]|nr:type II toxin-antitoxin system Phd/YefM family antitoxin [Caldilineaceae bacterium]